MFFKDKGMFFTSLITPAILLVLYVTFLADVYRDTFTSSLPQGIALPQNIADGLVGAQLMSSILAVSCVTVAFCSNFLMVQDKSNGSVRDLRMTPVSPAALAVGYYAATFISTFIIAAAGMALCLIYVWAVGWFMSLADVLFLLLDVFVLTLFGTALSSVVNFFLSTQGQASAVGTIVSAGYGFICGAYMPISSFDEGLRNVLSCLPGTYGTSLIRNHSLRGVLSAMSSAGAAPQVTDSVRDFLDCNLYFFGSRVGIGEMYAVLVSSVAVLLAVYIVMNVAKSRK